MKTTIFALAAIAGLASAQFPGIPSCATNCLSSAVTAAGCKLSDVGCQCTSTAAIQGSGAGCILGACGPADINSALTAGLGLCSSYFAAIATASASTTTSLTTVKSTTTLTTTPLSANSTTTVTAKSTSIPAPSTTAPPLVGNTTITGTSRSLTPTPSSSPSRVSVGGAAPTLIAGVAGLVGIVAGVVAGVL